MDLNVVSVTDSFVITAEALRGYDKGGRFAGNNDEEGMESKTDGSIIGRAPSVLILFKHFVELSSTSESGMRSA